MLVLGDEGPPEANVDEPRLGPCEDTTLPADIGPVAGLSVSAGGNVRIASLSPKAPVNVHVRGASLNPSPDMSDAAFPPIWVWDSPLEVALDCQ